MNHIEIANLAGVHLGDLESLIAGRVTANVANSIGAPIGDIQDLISGSASAVMTATLGLTTISAAQELARAVGPNGVVGILIGILISH